MQRQRAVTNFLTSWEQDRLTVPSGWSWLATTMCYRLFDLPISCCIFSTGPALPVASPVQQRAINISPTATVFLFIMWWRFFSFNLIIISQLPFFFFVLAYSSEQAAHHPFSSICSHKTVAVQLQQLHVPFLLNVIAAVPVKFKTLGHMKSGSAEGGRSGAPFATFSQKCVENLWRRGISRRF